ncbi:MAG: hypothetical protein OPY08_01185 [Nitrosopumilus sp.]|nr:hypothetical protein [Nitrosopumilus sp.]MDF2425034.1 hypothetical protein [Nitrosopumilus sp.]MDF2429937.1 hypothetical protein [Nitrosopumilus sp.]
MAKKLGPPIFLGVFTVLAIVFLTGGASDDNDILRQTFQVDAIYYDSGHVEISYVDKSGQTDSVIMEILGMDESFQKSFLGSQFVEIVPFPNVPKYGWAIHPIVLEIDHLEFGHIQLKTEIHAPGQPIPPVIYSRP